MSSDTATAQSPMATAEAAPPEEPPGVSAWSYGLRVWPEAGLAVLTLAANSGTLVAPKTMACAARKRTTISQSWQGT